MGFNVEIQKTIYATLTGNAPLMALIKAVYDDVPQSKAGDDSVYPYISIGEDIANPWNTDTSNGANALITLHSWSAYNGRKETKEIQDAVYNALHRQPLSVSGFSLVTMEFESATSFLDNDGLTRHGVQTFRMILDEP